MTIWTPLFIKCDEDDQYVYGVYFVPEHEAQKVHAVYSSMHFERIFVRMNIRVPPERLSKTRQTAPRHPRGSRCQQGRISAFPETSVPTKIVSAKATLEACSRNFRYP